MESENKCECNCGNEGNLTLQDSSNVIYKICHNCIFELINLNLSKEHFFNLLKNGHKDNEFYLHDDFYDKNGKALQGE